MPGFLARLFGQNTVPAVPAEPAVPSITIPDLDRFLGLAGIADYDTLKTKAKSKIDDLTYTATVQYADADGIRQVAFHDYEEETRSATEKRNKKLLRASQIEATANDLSREAIAASETLSKLP